MQKTNLGWKKFGSLFVCFMIFFVNISDYLGKGTNSPADFAAFQKEIFSKIVSLL